MSRERASEFRNDDVITAHDNRTSWLIVDTKQSPNILCYFAPTQILSLRYNFVPFDWSWWSRFKFFCCFFTANLCFNQKVRTEAGVKSSCIELCKKGKKHGPWERAIVHAFTVQCSIVSKWQCERRCRTRTLPLPVLWTIEINVRSNHVECNETSLLRRRKLRCFSVVCQCVKGRSGQHKCIKKAIFLLENKAWEKLVFRESNTQVLTEVCDQCWWWLVKFLACSAQPALCTMSSDNIKFTKVDSCARFQPDHTSNLFRVNGGMCRQRRTNSWVFDLNHQLYVFLPFHFQMQVRFWLCCFQAVWKYLLFDKSKWANRIWYLFFWWRTVQKSMHMLSLVTLWKQWSVELVCSLKTQSWIDFQIMFQFLHH